MGTQENIKNIFKHRYPFKLKEEGMHDDVLVINKKQVFFNQEYETKKKKKIKKNKNRRLFTRYYRWYITFYDIFTIFK